jgi:transposase-like protein
MGYPKKEKGNPMKTKTKKAEELVRELGKAKSIDDFYGKEGIFSRLFSKTIEQMLEAELTTELGYERTRRLGEHSGGDSEIKVPRDRNGEFQSELLKKNSNEIEQKVTAMYAKGMSTRDIQGVLTELYGIEVSPETISAIADKVWPLVEEWQNRPLAGVYAMLFLDAIHVKLKREGKITNVAIYNVQGVDLSGHREIFFY